MVAVIAGAFAVGTFQAVVTVWVQDLQAEVSAAQAKMDEHREEEGHPILAQRVLTIEREINKQEGRERQRWVAIEKLQGEIKTMNANILRLCTKAGAGCK